MSTQVHYSQDYFNQHLSMAYKEFYDLNVYKNCRIFRKKISTIVRCNFPKSERYLLSSQLLDASRSVTANIAEGHGRYYFKENIHFCRIARGSLTECLDHLLCAFDESYLDEKTFIEMKALQSRCLKQLNAYITHLKGKSRAIQ